LIWNAGDGDIERPAFGDTDIETAIDTGDADKDNPGITGDAEFEKNSSDPDPDPDSLTEGDGDATRELFSHSQNLDCNARNELHPDD